MVYFAGVDVPLTELIIAIGVVAIIILFEIIVVLVMINYNLRSSKRIEEQIRRLSASLMQLENKEFRELEKIEKIEGKKLALLPKLKKHPFEPIHKKVKRNGRLREFFGRLVNGFKRRK